jgi:hypothetical protein
MGTVTTLPSGGRRLVREYRGSKIWLTEDYRFEVVGEGFAGYESRMFGSLKEAEAKIDQIMAAEARSQRERVSLCVLNSSGNAETITGLHGKTGDVLGVSDSSDFYPNVGWLAEMLMEKKRLYDRMTEINKTIQPYRIRRSYSVGYHGNSEAAARRHAEAIAELKATYEKATERAEVAAKAGITLASDHK